MALMSGGMAGGMGLPSDGPMPAINEVHPGNGRPVPSRAAQMPLRMADQPDSSNGVDPRPVYYQPPPLRRHEAAEAPSYRFAFAPYLRSPSDMPETPPQQQQIQLTNNAALKSALASPSLQQLTSNDAPDSTPAPQQYAARVSSLDTQSAPP